MMRQYMAMKRAHPGALLLFRMGDFYETFFDDAKIMARELDLVLTARDRKSDNPVPLAGIPHHALEGYLARLVRKGYRVAICDQVEDPKQARGLVKRAVTRVVSPGTVVEESLLSTANNFLVTLASDREGATFGLAALDLSTGEFLATQLEGARASERLHSELSRLHPTEVVIPEGPAGELLERMVTRFNGTELSTQSADDQNGAGTSSGPADHSDLVLPTRNTPGAATISRQSERDYFIPEASRRLQEQFGVGSVEGLGFELSSRPLAVSAAGAALAYVLSMQESELGHIERPRPYNLSDHMVLDSVTQRNLELVESLRGGSRQQTLLGVLDRTVTAGGARLLRQWILAPLLDRQAIEERLEAVSHLLERLGLRGELRQSLSGIADLERVLSRIGHGSANGRDLVALTTGLERVVQLRGRFHEMGAVTRLPAGPEDPDDPASLSDPEDPADPSDPRSQRGNETHDEAHDEANDEASTEFPRKLGLAVEALDDHPELADRLNRALAEDPPTTITEGNLIREGYSKDLDELKSLARMGKEWIAALERSERQRTGIPSLKVGYNRVFGYYLEVTKKWVKRVPEDYHRKQTLANAERYVTPELKEKESALLNAEDKARALEHELFCQLREAVAQELESLQSTARALSLLDVLACLAQVAQDNDYCRPTITGQGRIIIREGRHPVVERVLIDQAGFVPNPCRLDDVAHQLLLITGPNMGGKSTYMRQVALTILMAQMGSYVPATRAEVGLVDRIFTRVGASDDLAAGQSTFMVEMLELAHILANASPRSLVLLDEIGRGTATHDGLALAWAVAEHLHRLAGKGVKTLFATHYHALTDLSRFLPRVKNLQVMANEEGDELIFLHQVLPGTADRSFGIQVGRLAGLPLQVVERAEKVLERLEAQERPTEIRDLPAGKSPTQTLLFSETMAAAEPVIEYREHPALDSLQELDPMNMTPMEALEVLWELKKQLL